MLSMLHEEGRHSQLPEMSDLELDRKATFKLK